MRRRRPGSADTNKPAPASKTRRNKAGSAGTAKRSPSRFRRREVTRAIKAMQDAKESVARVEIGADGKIIIVLGKPADGGSADSPERIISQL
jgi:hypothetical protein